MGTVMAGEAGADGLGVVKRRDGRLPDIGVVAVGA